MKLLLCSSDAYFIEAFSYLLSKKRHDVMLESYSDESRAREQLGQGKYNVLLCEQGYLEEYIGQSFYIELGNTTMMPKEDKLGKLNIYQRAELILEDLGHILSFTEGGEAADARAEKRIAFFSTEGGSGKTTIAYLTSVISAKKRKTLYWNLCPFGATDNLYRTEFQHGMEEIMYAQHEKSGVLELLYETITCNADGVYVLPNIKSLGDYKSLTSDEIKELCEAIVKTGMECIILDLPGCYSTWTEELLLISEKIVWVYGGTESSIRREELVKTDPYLKRFLDKSIFVRNKAQQKEESKIAFPMSTTMQKASQISKVLDVNPEFVSGCLAIEKNVM